MKWKQYHTFILIASIVFLVWYTRNKYNTRMEEAQNKSYSEQDFIQGLPKVLSTYGKDIAKRVEQIFRLETAHFKSQQFIKTGTPGMESHGLPPNYGWYAPFFVANPSYLPLGTIQMKENQTPKTKTFIVMPSVEATMMFLADYIKRWGNAARWYSTNPESQAKYIASLDSIIPRHFNNLT
jgi:hypothetical protein